MGLKAEWGDRIGRMLARGVVDFEHGASSGARGWAHVRGSRTAEDVVRASTIRTGSGRVLNRNPWWRSERGGAVHIGGRARRAAPRAAGAARAAHEIVPVVEGNGWRAVGPTGYWSDVFPKTKKNPFLTKKRMIMGGAAIAGGTAFATTRNRSGAPVTTNNPTGIRDMQGY